MSDPAVLAAVKSIAVILPELVTWAASLFRSGGDPEAELRAMMASAEEAAREAERRKFGQ